MSDNLTIFGTDYINVAGIKATGTGNGTLTYIRPQGTKSIGANGTGIDVAAYASVDVNVSGGGTPTLQAKTRTIDSAGTFVDTPDSGYDGLSSVTTTVPEGEMFAGIGSYYYTESGARKWRYQSYAAIEVGDSYGTPGFIENGTIVYSVPYVHNAIPTGTTVTPSTSSQTIGGSHYMMEGPVTVSAMPSGTAGTPTATKGNVSNHSVSVTPSVTNTTGYITGGTKNGTAVSVSASELVSGSQTITSNGTVDVTNLASVVVNVSGGSGGGSAAAQTATSTVTPSSAGNTIRFTNLEGQPTSFAVLSAADLATGASPFKVAAVVYDGTSVHAQTVTNTNNAQATYDGSAFSQSYSNGTLTITSSGAYFQAVQYKLVYTYGSSNVIETAQTQVGSGATSITFTGLTAEPSYFGVIFKSNFSTSSGYQRVMAVARDGSSTYGVAMDSGAKALSSWSYTYSNGSLTVTSTGTNNGGYFHQPGYYQLVCAYGTVEPDLPTYQDKTVTPTESEQTVEADDGYDALSSVTVGAISSTYVGSGVPQRDSDDITVSGGTVSFPSGYYDDNWSTAVASGTAGTPTATKGNVVSNSVTVTPSVTNTTGYITGGTKTGTGISVSASELVSGTLTISSSGTKDVTNYASASVAAGATGTPTATKGSVSNHAISVTPSVTNSTGYITGGTKTGTAVSVSASELVSGNLNITANTTSTDVTNYATVSVAVPIVTYYTSTSNPTSSQGSNGDIWLVTA